MKNNIIKARRLNVLDGIIIGCLTLLLLILFLNAASAYDNVAAHPITYSTISGEKSKFDTFLFLKETLSNLEKPFQIKRSDSMLTFLKHWIGASVLVALWYVTTLKNTITGKEYGTARWGKVKELRSLFAKNLLKKAIRKTNFKYFLKILWGKLLFLFKKSDTYLSEIKKKKFEQIEQLKQKFKNSEMIITKVIRFCMFNFKINNNVLVIGGSGAGKSRYYALPNILQGFCSNVITDPKGELLYKTGYFLTKIAETKVKVLNLYEKFLSNGYNPIKYIHRERHGWEERVLSLIGTIIMNTESEEKNNSSDPFWEKAETLFMQSLVFATVCAFPEEESNLNTTIELMSWLKFDENSQTDSKDSELDVFFDIFGEIYGTDHIGYLQYREFRDKAAMETAKSIVISASARLAPLRVKEIKRIISYDEMELDKIGEEKTALFIVVPPVDSTYNFLAGILCTQLFDELNYCALTKNRENGQKLPVMVKFILDEFATTFKIPNFLKILAYARSLGISISVLIQSLDQLKEMFRESWGIVVDNCSTLLYLGGIKHVDTLEYISKLLGKGTFSKKSYGKSYGRQGSASTNTDSLGRELMLPDEVGKIDVEKCLTFITGKYPYYTDKYSYINHPNYKYTSDANSEYGFNFKPPSPPVIASSIQDDKESGETPLFIELDTLEMDLDMDSATRFLKGAINSLMFDGVDEFDEIEEAREDEDADSTLMDGTENVNQETGEILGEILPVSENSLWKSPVLDITNTNGTVSMELLTDENLATGSPQDLIKILNPDATLFDLNNIQIDDIPVVDNDMLGEEGEDNAILSEDLEAFSSEIFNMKLENLQAGKDTN